MYIIQNSIVLKYVLQTNDTHPSLPSGDRPQNAELPSGHRQPHVNPNYGEVTI